MLHETTEITGGWVIVLVNVVVHETPHPEVIVVTVTVVVWVTHAPFA